MAANYDNLVFAILTPALLALCCVPRRAEGDATTAVRWRFTASVALLSAALLCLVYPEFWLGQAARTATPGLSAEEKKALVARQSRFVNFPSGIRCVAGPAQGAVARLNTPSGADAGRAGKC